MKIFMLIIIVQNILFGAMELGTTPLYPRYLPFRIPPHQAVTVVGQIVNLSDHSPQLFLQPDPESSSTITVNFHETFESAELRNVKFLEVRGISESNGSITMKQYCNLKDGFDLKTYNQVLKLSNDGAFRSLFGIRS